MIQSSLSHWLKGRKMTKPIRIRSTNEFSVMLVRAELLPNDLFTLCSLEQGLGKWLKSSTLPSQTHRLLLIVYSNDILASRLLSETLFLRMRAEGFSLDWTVV